MVLWNFFDFWELLQVGTKVEERASSQIRISVDKEVCGETDHRPKLDTRSVTLAITELYSPLSFPLLFSYVVGDSFGDQGLLACPS